MSIGAWAAFGYRTWRLGLRYRVAVVIRILEAISNLFPLLYVNTWKPTYRYNTTYKQSDTSLTPRWRQRCGAMVLLFPVSCRQLMVS
jgi:hypothetical protein